MRKTTFLALFATLMLAGTTFAQIRQGSIGNGTYTDWDGTQVPNIYGLDFNNDGNVEFKISDFATSHDYIIYNWTDGGNNVVASNEGWDYAAALTQGTTIGPSSAWDGQGDCMITTTSPSQYYLGFRIRLTDGVHYGWALVTASASEITWVKIFYQATVGASINAGDEGSTGITTATNDNWKLSATGNRSIRIFADANEQFRIYNTAGQLMATCQGNSETTMPAKGVYVVKNNGTAKKVVVF